MTMPSPRHTEELFGHHEAEQCFLNAFQTERLHHAWLISGPAGIGKATLAFRLARHLLKGDDPMSPTGRRVRAGTHGDLLEISRQIDPRKGRLRGEITVSDVQPIQNFLHHTATEGGWRVVIVDGVEFLNRFAANALLKILEEPPAQTVLLLTTTAPGALLPTLRSRCRRLALSPLSDDAMRAVLPHVSMDVIKRAHGSPGRALFLARDKDGRIAALAQQALEGQPMESALWQEIGQLAREADGFALLCDLLGEGIAQRARHAAQHGDLAGAARFAEKKSALETLRSQTESFSLDKGQAMRQAFDMVSSLEASRPL
ncbi:DNA polymerase III subunit delta' [Saccharibacter floricola DSM 15669]|uniref:DNA polymerase III subunit delta n=2 Tax=Saccharibacter TaxID=231052 RepID=A0ABQ0NZF0_9PROT|nr:DNA polymerase III subunit delta' [Saccharibacter floricola DSM 15669]